MESEIQTTQIEDLQEQEWYQYLIEECEAILVESKFAASWIVIEGYHALGKRILEENDNFERRKIYRQKILQCIAESLGKSERTIYYAVQFARKYPDLNLLPGGKNITWFLICRDLLPAHKEEENILEPIEGQYRTIVIDPPWPMQKILREVRPKQRLELGYRSRVMTIDEIKAIPLKDWAIEDGCHIYLWTTQKFLPVSFEVFEAWGVNYECLLTWVKNVGFTPYSWMYSTEHVLFGRIGSLELLKKGKRLDFEDKVREHSRKPDKFYDLVREVSPQPRIDVFSRERREGFEQYGDETNNF